MSSYRERLTAPLSWWVTALAFGLVCGWIMLVATNPPIAVVSAVLGALAAGALVWSYGAVVVEAGPAGLRVGSAHLSAAHVGDVTALDRRELRERLGPEADARAWLRTRPYIDVGVQVEVTDASDPTPYWLVSCRRPEALAEALRHTGQARPMENGDVHGGQEEEV